jgi:hypothetical protein
MQKAPVLAQSDHLTDSERFRQLKSVQQTSVLKALPALNIGATKKLRDESLGRM